MRMYAVHALLPSIRRAPFVHKYSRRLDYKYRRRPAHLSFVSVFVVGAHFICGSFSTSAIVQHFWVVFAFVESLKVACFRQHTAASVTGDPFSHRNYCGFEASHTITGGCPLPELFTAGEVVGKCTDDAYYFRCCNPTWRRRHQKSNYLHARGLHTAHIENGKLMCITLPQTFISTLHISIVHYYYLTSTIPHRSHRGSYSEPVSNYLLLAEQPLFREANERPCSSWGK